MKLKIYYYYPKFHKEIQKFIDRCEICKLAKYDKAPIKHSMNFIPTPGKHNYIIHVHIWFPQRGTINLTNIDKLRKYGTTYYFADKTWISRIKALKRRIQYFRKPNQLIANNEINICKTTAFLKIGNLDVEILHETLNEHIRVFNADPEDKDDLCEEVSPDSEY